MTNVAISRAISDVIIFGIVFLFLLLFFATLERRQTTLFLLVGNSL